MVKPFHWHIQQFTARKRPPAASVEFQQRRFTECTRDQKRFQPWTLHRSILLVTGISAMWLPLPCILF